MTEKEKDLSIVLNRITHRYVLRGSGLPLILLPDDHYFVERTLIELGLLRGDKNMCAHKAYLKLMDDICCPIAGRAPHPRDFACAARCITTQPYPWQPADNADAQLHADDLPRRRAIYVTLRRLLTEAGLIQQ